jgi:hypothetical protein
LKHVLEAWHARRAVGDDLSGKAVVATKCPLVQRRTIGARVPRGREMTNAARLREHSAAEPLLVVEAVGWLLRERIWRACGQQEHKQKCNNENA